MDWIQYDEVIPNEEDIKASKNFNISSSLEVDFDKIKTEDDFWGLVNKK
ncbi:MAG: hypothetical protein LBD88_01170 [Candidatus Peribacteria bacterium]|jgi:hypothetical protein|nr:hypothetical protein [Candidatus Peribacteria bacterium]